MDSPSRLDLKERFAAREYVLGIDGTAVDAERGVEMIDDGCDPRRVRRHAKPVPECLIRLHPRPNVA